MEQIGYSLIDSNNKEIQFWGDTLGQCPGIPDMIVLPNGDQVHAPFVNSVYGNCKFVTRWADYDPTLINLISGNTILYAGEKTIVTYQYRNPNQQELIAYSANTRYTKETSGIKVSNNLIYTDRQSQAMLTSVVTLMQLQPNTVISYKTGNGFISANSQVINQISTAVASYIEQCFSTEHTVSDSVANGSITLYSQIDTAYSSIVSVIGNTTSNTTANT